MKMKLIIAIVQDHDASRLVNALSDANFRSTTLATTGGFLKEGNTTLLIGCQEEQVDEVLKIINNHCSERRMEDLNLMRASVNLYSMSPIVIRGATVFIVPIDSFHRF